MVEFLGFLVAKPSLVLLLSARRYRHMFSFLLNGSLGDHLAPVVSDNARLEAFIERGQVEAAFNFLLDSNSASFDVNAPTSKGKQLLHAASEKGYGSLVVELIRRHGAKIEARDQEGKTALLAAAMHGRHDVAFVLLEFGADYSARDVRIAEIFKKS